METLFESYVAHMLKKHLNSSIYSLSIQESKISLFDKPKSFTLRPDIVIRDKDNNVFILDTKWKLLSSENKINYGISQADMYQMYAYQRRYKSKNVSLVYPKSPYFKQNKDISYLSARDGDTEAIINLKFFDLLNPHLSLSEIENGFSNAFIKT